MADIPLTHIIVTLRGGNWERLEKLVTQPDVKHQTGGFQNRKAKWRTRINIAAHSIELDADDIDWIRRQIENRKNGGWQQHVSDIFAGQHPFFSGLRPAPRKKPEQRKKRVPEPGLLPNG